MENMFELGLDKAEANYTPLTPITFIQRTALAHPSRTAVIHGDLRRSWAETYQRCLKMASALRKLGIGKMTYEDLLASGDDDFEREMPDDEWQAIALNYTSGTTGNPKGVVYHHRGAHLNALSNVIGFGLPSGAVYLWTLPMFHCNGWCYPWAVTAAAGTHVCLRAPQPEPVFDAIARHGVTHFCAAPVVLNMLINAPEEVKKPFSQTVTAATGGAAPPAATIEAMEAMGINVVHLYG